MATEYKLSYTGNEINQKLGKIDGLIQTEEKLTDEIAVERSRINNIIAHNNDTSGNSELLDLRVDHEGNIHSSAGDAVRYQTNKIYNDVDILYPYAYIKEQLFEYGTLYKDANVVRYENSNIVIRTVSKTSIHLKKDDVIYGANGISIRVILNVDGVLSQQNYFEGAYTLPSDGEYYFAIKYTDDREILSKEEILSLFYIISKKDASLYNGICEKTQADIIDILSPYTYLSEAAFESGTMWTENNRIYYQNDSTVIRTVRDSYFSLKKGDCVTVADDVIYRIITEIDGVFSSYGYTNENYTISEDANCYFAIRYKDHREITSIVDLLSKFIIKKREYVEYDQNNTLPSINNEAKSIFAVMSYNVGRWYNGSGQIVPSEKYEEFLSLQSNIIDRYKPDVLCLQEYGEYISDAESAKANLLANRYHFIETAYATTTYDGKAICTNRELKDAINISFTTTDGSLIRNYEKAYVYMNGRKVCVISAHLSTVDNTKIDNVNDLINAVANEEYFIICADTNIDCNNTDSALYQNTLQKFVNLDYKLCNGGEFGTFNTHEETNAAIDNIITSANINIKSVIMDNQKAGLVDGTDHYPIIAYIEVF